MYDISLEMNLKCRRLVLSSGFPKRCLTSASGRFLSFILSRAGRTRRACPGATPEGDELLGRGGGRGLAAGSFGGVGLLTAGPFEVVVLVDRFGTGDGLVVGGAAFSARPSSGVEGAALKGGGPDGFGGTP